MNEKEMCIEIAFRDFKSDKEPTLADSKRMPSGMNTRKNSTTILRLHYTTLRYSHKLLRIFVT